MLDQRDRRERFGFQQWRQLLRWKLIGRIIQFVQLIQFIRWQFQLQQRRFLKQFQLRWRHEFQQFLLRRLFELLQFVRRKLQQFQFEQWRLIQQQLVFRRLFEFIQLGR